MGQCDGGVGCITILVSGVTEGLFEEVTLDLTLNGGHGKGAVGKSWAGVLHLASLTRMLDFSWRLCGRDGVGHMVRTGILPAMD